MKVQQSKVVEMLGVDEALVEQALGWMVTKLAPRLNPDLALLYERERQKENWNLATLTVARKLVAYLVAVDRGERTFVASEHYNRTAA